MRHLARASNVTDGAEIETWGLVGMLHDFDYEKYPTAQDHVFRGMEILRARGWPELVVKAIGAHAFYTGIPRETRMEKAILAADELTGFVGACALIRPTKKIADVPVESVLKRLKEKSFARSVDRSYVTKGAEEWGLPLPELVALVLASQVPIADLDLLLHSGSPKDAWVNPGGGHMGRSKEWPDGKIFEQIVVPWVARRLAGGD